MPPIFSASISGHLGGLRRFNRDVWEHPLSFMKLPWLLLWESDFCSRRCHSRTFKQWAESGGVRKCGVHWRPAATCVFVRIRPKEIGMCILHVAISFNPNP